VTLKPITIKPGTLLQAHEFAEDYPLVEGPPLWTMADAMKNTGFYSANPIVLRRNRDGDLRVLDGRRRQMAAKRIGIDPPFVEFIGTDLEALAYVEAMNYHRRNLGEADRESISKKTVGRRALLAGMASTAESGKSRKCWNSDTTVIPPKTLAEAAKEQGISRDTAAEGKLVATKGTPDQQSAVASGERSVSDVAQEIRDIEKTASNSRKQRTPKRKPDGFDFNSWKSHLGYVLRGLDEMRRLCSARYTPQFAQWRNDIAERRAAMDKLLEVVDEATSALRGK
jgi:hypothetical protein